MRRIPYRTILFSLLLLHILLSALKAFEIL